MSPYLHQLIYAGSYLLGAVLVAIVLRKALSRLAARHDHDPRALLDDVFRSLRTPIILLVLIAGIHLSLKQVDVVRPYMVKYADWFGALATFAVLIGLTQLASIAIAWYGQRAAEAGAVPGQMGLLRKLAVMAIWIVGFVQIMSQLHKPIGTVLASVGLVGLAVGLALQDTIANIFAGFYIVADRSLRAGDYVQLENGPEGFVESVGWRNTRIRLWANNIVLVPNNKLVQSVITNMTLPNPALSVYTYCGVAYDSDLEQVERVTLEVANQVIRQFDGSDLTFDPVVRFKEFGDSNINFVVVFRAVEVGAQYRLQHEFIKALHARFKEDNIEISFPVRKLVWPEPVRDPRTAALDS